MIGRRGKKRREMEVKKPDTLPGEQRRRIPPPKSNSSWSSFFSSRRRSELTSTFFSPRTSERDLAFASSFFRQLAIIYSRGAFLCYGRGLLGHLFLLAKLLNSGVVCAVCCCCCCCGIRQHDINNTDAVKGLLGQLHLPGVCGEKEG